MKFSMVNGARHEAQPGLKGQCPGCGGPTIAKCGNVKVHHWSHKGKRMCDPWWENETEWHRNWKNHFPEDWQERHHVAKNGEKHIADVKTIKDWVIEFQHSYLKPEERNARNDFYEKLVWIVNGTRRKRDKSKFFESLTKVFEPPNPQLPVRNIFKVLWNDCALFRDWLGCPTPVFFDFGNDEPMLWCLLPQISNGKPYILEVHRDAFIALHRNKIIESDIFADLMRGFRSIIAELSSPPPARIQNILLPARQQRYNRRL